MTIKDVIQPICPPRGRNVRRGLFQLCVGLGVAYLFFSHTMPASSLSYDRQSDLMPLPWFGVAFVLVALALRLTRSKRNEMPGRMAAVVASVLLFLFAWTFYPTSVTGVVVYGVLAWAAAGEAFFVTDGN